MRPKKPHITPAQTKAMQAPLNSRSLDEIVATAKREAHELERLKIIASPQARAHRDNLVRKGELDGNAKIGLVEQISAYAAKERERRGRRNAAQPATVLEARLRHDNRPTAERTAKLMGVDTITPPIKDDDTRATTRAYTVQGVVEFYRDKWTYEELQGAQYLQERWNKAATAQQAVTVNYDGVPGLAHGPRPGGLRGSEKAIGAHQDILYIEAILFAQFGVKGLNLVRWFAWETKLPDDSASLGDQMVTAGRSLAPFVRDAGRLWGLTFGSLQTIFRFAYAQWVVKEEAMKRQHSSPEEIAARRKERRERLARSAGLHPEDLLRAAEE